MSGSSKSYSSKSSWDDDDDDDDDDYSAPTIGSNGFPTLKTLKDPTDGTGDPWKMAQPAMERALGSARSYFEDGKGFNAYDQSMVVPWGADTLAGMQSMRDTSSMYNSAMQNPMAHYQGLFSGGGFNAPQMASLAQLGNFAGGQGYNAQSQQGINSLMGLNNQLNASGGLSGLQGQSAAGYGGMAADGGLNAMQRNAAQGYMGLAEGDGLTDWQRRSLSQNAGVAAGNDMDMQTPGFQRMLGNVQDSVREAANKQAMASGRFNSARHQDVLQDNIGDVTARMYGDEYNRQLGRRDSAVRDQFNMGGAGVGQAERAYGALANIGQMGTGNQQTAYAGLGNLGQTGIGNRNSSANALFGAGNTGFGNVMGAVQNRFNAGQTGIDNLGNASAALPGAYGTAQQRANDQMMLGSMDEDLMTRQMNDDQRRFQELEMADWNRLNALNAIATGQGVGARFTNPPPEPEKAKEPSAISGAIGGALQGYGMTGSLLGGALGGLGGLLF